MQTGSLGHMPKDKLLLADRYVTEQKSPSHALLASLTLAGQRKGEIRAYKSDHAVVGAV